MLFRKVVACVSVASMILPGLALAQAPSVTVTSPASCVAPQGTYKVTANIPGDVAMARVLFRAEGTTCPTSEYYVEMRRGENGNFWALLPVVAQGTGKISYRVWARSANGAQRVTEVKTVNVDASCAIPSWSADEQKFAQNIAIGLTNGAQNAEPCGFLCNGVARVINADGTMVANQACAATLAAAAAAGTTAGVGAAAAGGSAAATIAGAGLLAGMGAGAGVLLGLGLVAGAVAIDESGDDDKPVSPARP